MDGVAVDVSQLLDVLLGSPYIEVVIPFLPKVMRTSKMLGAPHNRLLVVWVFLCGRPNTAAEIDLSPRDRLFESFDRRGQRASFRLAHQQVNVLGHDDITVNEEPVLRRRFFKSLLEHLRCAVLHQKRLAAVATEGDEM